MVSEKDILARDSSSCWANAGNATSRKRTAATPLLTSELSPKRVREAIDSRPSQIFFILVTEAKKVKLAAKGKSVFPKENCFN
jgi:hypothetical protein